MRQPPLYATQHPLLPLLQGKHIKKIYQVLRQRDLPQNRTGFVAPALILRAGTAENLGPVVLTNGFWFNSVSSAHPEPERQQQGVFMTLFTD